MQKFSQNTGWTLLAGELNHQKGPYGATLNWLRWKKEGRRRTRASRTRPTPQGGVAEGKERFPHPGKSIETEGKNLGLSVMNQLVCDSLDRVRITQTICTPQTVHTLGWNTCVLVCTGAKLEHGDWRASLGQGLLLAVRRWPKETGWRKSATRNAFGGKLNCHESRALLLSYVQGLEPKKDQPELSLVCLLPEAKKGSL